MFRTLDYIIDFLQIAPAAKKLWGIEGKDAKSLALNHLNHHDGGVWRDPTWAAPGKFMFAFSHSHIVLKGK